MKAGEAITKLLADYGVRHVFGIPGTHTLELYRGLAADYGVSHVLAHHEQGAGFMADGYARTSGCLGVCFVITGAGVTNAATAMAEAYADSVPMLVISPINPPDGSGHNQGRLHEITDQAAVTAPLTAFSAIAHDLEQIPQLIARAFNVYSSARPRPVHISVPLPLLHEEVAEPWRPADRARMPVASDEDIQRARQFIEKADHPVVVAGGGTRYCAEAVQTLAEAMGCPVITTVAGRGVVPASHPLCAGQLRTLATQRLLAEADLVMLLATDLAQTDHWSDDLSLPEYQVRINIDSANLVASGEVVAIKGDVADAARRLGSVVTMPGLKQRTQTSATRCRALQTENLDAMTAKEKRHWQVLRILRQALPAAATVFSDMTQLAYTAIDFMTLERANSWHHPSGYGTLGYALPAAIGSAVADPEHPVVVMVGDGGLQYTMQEMPLAAELGLNITMVQWNNDSLEQIKDDMQDAGIPPTGVSQRNPDFELLAQACGWEYHRVGDLSALAQSLNKAFAHRGPYLLQLDEHRMFP